MKRLAERDSTHNRRDEKHPPIAIIGIGCRFPGNANDPASFWNLLENGVDAITEIPANRWNGKRYYDSDTNKPGKLHTQSGGFIKNIDQFDPHFFGISPREAARVDPQHRMLLEVAWEALEDGGQVLERIAGGNTAVFVGISSWDYSFQGMSFVDRGTPDVHSNTGGSLSIAANRISYSFDFRGPSAAVDTACSSGLVAVHLACQSIWEQNCNLALAGGVSALLLPDWYIGFSRLGMLAPDGRCKAFDARANGFVRSEGAGLILLKPLAQAIADGDRIYAVIRGTAMNQDGRTQGMTVPSQSAQEALLLQACHDAGVSPSQIQYVEAHGTGTQVGDPIEALALGRVLGPGRPEGERCLVGSVKSNIGHLEAGAGAASVIKVALSMYHQKIPRNLHFIEPNPNIDFDQLRLRIPTRNQPWPKANGPALAGINSFGYGGTNAHLIVGKAPQSQKEISDLDAAFDGPVLLPLSAACGEALAAAAKSMAHFIANETGDIPLSDIAGNAIFRRTHHEHRLAVVAQSKDELVKLLSAFTDAESVPEITTGRAIERKTPRLAFVCSGQGPQWWAMGRQLLEREPVFREVVERCDAVALELGVWSLLDELRAEESDSRMAVTAVSQPCIYALQVGLASLLASWGIRPSALVGHSVGEVAAAHLAGVFSLEEGMRVIYHRGRCMELASPFGRMLAAACGEADAETLVAKYDDRATIAAINSPTSVTFSGEDEALNEIAAILEKRGVFHKFLQVNYAFHSSQMDPIREELLEALADIRPRRAARPMFSTVTGQRVEGPELDAEYWWNNVRHAVRFADGVNRLADADFDTVVELSPHPVLSGSISECFDARGKTVTVLPTLRRKTDEKQSLLRTAGALYTMGCRLKWSGILPRPKTFVQLPKYPWQHESCWFESDESRHTRTTPPAHPLLGCSVDGPLPIWQNRMDLQLFPFMADHRVQGAALLPATAFLETAFAVAREVAGEAPWQIEDFRLANACFLHTDESLWMQTSCAPDDAALRIHSRVINSDKPWTAHVTAMVSTAAGLAASTKRIDPATFAQRCPQEFSREEFYQHLKSLGLDYGDQFQVVTQGRRTGGESFGRIELPESLDTNDYHLHPVLFDACFQLVGAADPDFQKGTGIYLPVSVHRAQFFHSPGRRAWCHTRMIEKKADTFTAHLDIYDEDGVLAASVRELQCRRMAGAEKGESIQSLQYAFHWRPSADELSEETKPQRNGAQRHPEHWLIFADQTGVGDRLAGRLRERGDHCSIVSPGFDFAEDRNDRYRVNPCSVDDIKRLVHVVFERGRQCHGIVHLWSLDAQPDDLTESVEAGVFSGLHLVQAWEQIAPEVESRLFFVTNGAQSVSDDPQETALAQSPILGLGRVIGNECPKLHCQLVDLPSNFDAADEVALFDVLSNHDSEDEIAMRGGRRFVQRFLPFTEVAPTTQELASDGPFRLTTMNPGTLDGLRFQSLDRRPPASNEVEIEVKAAGLNFADVLKALGLYPNVPDGPTPLGGECSGVVTRLGADVSGLSVGDEVIAVAPQSFGSHVTAKAALTVPKPSRLSFEEAATIPIAFLTAYYAMHHLGRLQPGESILIHSASGGVGQAAIQLAQVADAKIYATAGTEEKRAFLKQHGVDLVMDSRSLDFADEVMEHTGGKGVDLILNSLTGEAISLGMDILSDYGRFLEIGKRDIYGNTRLGLRPFRNNLSFFAIDLDRMTSERPAILGEMLARISKMAAEGRLAPLPSQVFSITEADAAFRQMQQGKHIGKIVLSFDKRPNVIAPNTDQPIAFKADATYLITGGLGGFGLATARWMVERGARNLALMGRRGLHSDESRQAVAEMENIGAKVSVVQADVAVENDVRQAFAEIDQQMPPLRGVIHAAMVLDDGMLVNLDHDWMRRVMAPKIQGAWNLHRQTQDRSLDWFILFSSLSSVFGHAGQGNYAAGNAFLDALAYNRRANGLPALTVNWGYLGDAGYISERKELAQRLERQGVHGFTIRQALACLEDAMRRRLVQVSVLKIDWARWRGLGSSGPVSPRFAHLLRDAEKHSACGEASGHSPHHKSPEERRAWLNKMLWEKVAHVLGTTPDKLDGETSLIHLGLDSLMAVEIRNWIEGELRIHVPIVELMRSPCLSRLAELLNSRFELNGATETPHRNGTTAEQHAGSNERNVERMSDEQVESLLAEMLQKK